ncbi:MAG: alpha/beta hydrolase [Verrucomicrobia bacterium]|nr:alpha/beta hydrolase [Verrucomicrobiota bacterium]
MLELNLTPARSLFAAFGRFSPAQPLRTLLRTTGKRLNPARLETLSSAAGPAVRAALAQGQGAPDMLACIRREKRGGTQPTIVLGGYVPDAGEQVYLVRGYLARQGSVYYVDYPRAAFNAELLAAQLDDLVAEINAREPAPPVILAVSFGAGVALDWLRRNRLAGRPAPHLGGLILISPVCSALDIVAPGETKPTTLLGRALKPMLDAPETENAAAVEKARAIFARMFEAGAQNKAALATLLTRHELHELRSGVQATIAGVTHAGAMARVRAMQAMACPSTYLTPELLPLSSAPTLILYAEKEGAVLSDRAPGRQALEKACASFFPRGICRVIHNPHGPPIQHASLIFHASNFLPVLGRFYRSLKNRKTLVST